MMQTSNQTGVAVAADMPYLGVMMRDPLSTIAMAEHLRHLVPDSARCFALEMQEQVEWANEAWGAYWAEVARLV